MNFEKNSKNLFSNPCRHIICLDEFQSAALDEFQSASLHEFQSAALHEFQSAALQSDSLHERNQLCRAAQNRLPA